MSSDSRLPLVIVKKYTRLTDNDKLTETPSN